MENINTSLLLLVIGMTTVFCVLLIVIYLGKGLILFVNRHFPDTTPAKTTAAPSPQAIGKPAIAAITAAVARLTHGRGRITRIEKQ